MDEVTLPSFDCRTQETGRWEGGRENKGQETVGQDRRDRCESKLREIAHTNRNADIKKREALIWNAETERERRLKKTRCAILQYCTER